MFGRCKEEQRIDVITKNRICTEGKMATREEQVSSYYITIIINKPDLRRVVK